jgi:small subunit ribosomal protein S1
MAASYDEQGNYLYPEGFDPETNEWLPGHETAQAEWERQYAEAQVRFEAHKRQVAESRKAEAEATAGGGAGTSGGTPESAPRGGDDAGAGSSYSSETQDEGGSLASDEALAALREKLTGGSS